MNNHYIDIIVDYEVINTLHTCIVWMTKINKTKPCKLYMPRIYILQIIVHLLLLLIDLLLKYLNTYYK